MEEYRYHLIENTSGNNDLLRAFFDSLSSLERKWIFALRLDGNVLTVSWAGWVPRSWQDRKEVNFPDGTVARVENRKLEGLQIAPSLLKALRFLARLKENNMELEGE